MPDPGEPTTRGDWLADWTATGAQTPTAGPRPADTAAERAARRQARQRLDAELADVRAELLRVDTKANSLLALAGVLLGGAVAVLGGSRNLPTAATAVAWTAVALVAAAVVLLAAAVRPRLDGDFSFVRWARYSGGQQLLDDLTGAGRTGDPLTDRADSLRWLSRALLGKYRSVRRAVSLLVAGLAVAALAAAVVTWAR